MKSSQNDEIIKLFLKVLMGCRFGALSNGQFKALIYKEHFYAMKIFWVIFEA